MKNIYYFLPTLNHGFQYSVWKDSKMGNEEYKWTMLDCTETRNWTIGLSQTPFEFLFQWEVDEVVIRFFKWSDKENGCPHNLELLLQASSLVAQCQKYDKIRPFLHFMV
ncbi:hypothetical protein AMTRI_Chr01g102540 [Amborella trichopoda]